jgi:dTDP-D-glucose 4,6-dehydratase
MDRKRVGEYGAVVHAAAGSIVDRSIERASASFTQ